MGPRLALCGNVFPGESLAEVEAALDGPVREWAGRVSEASLGLYLAAGAAREAAREPECLRRRLAGLGLRVWTANAFPFGGFHGRRVKERAFLPDWRDRARLEFTCDVARVLAVCLEGRESTGSLSTCPLGYGTPARRDPLAADHLRRAADSLRRLEEEHGVRLVLALEPEPDGAFERLGDLLSWLEALEEDQDPAGRRLGVCWDLCHEAVVGEDPGETARLLRASPVPVGKVQVSSALWIRERPGGDALRRLQVLAADPWFHQVRARTALGTRAWPDLAPFLADREAHGALEEVRVHCHVPLTAGELGDGLAATPWREALEAARGAGFGDFEVETYTLPLLPEEFGGGGLVETLAAEYETCARVLEEAGRAGPTRSPR